jgi:serine/threonine-protein kinase
VSSFILHASSFILLLSSFILPKMASNPEVFALLEEMLDSGRSAEEVCRDRPELLAEVRRRWQTFRLVDGSLAALFPDPQLPPATDMTTAVPRPVDLPQVPGYRVEDLLGHGGMGVVYKAWHLQLNRPVALKMLLAGPLARPDELERFLCEAQAVAGLCHANIVQIYDVGDVGGRPYFTMELVEGRSLADQIQELPQAARQAAALVATLADAIHVAHQRGIVHRDLKPGNILLTKEGTPKVSDFGLARRLEGNDRLTLSGVPVGTPSYMAPEQARGKRQAIGPATDVYALGAILYELLTGRPPFRAESAAATLQQVLADEPVPPARLNPQVPRDLATICLKCLAKEPPRRYPSADALAEDLRRFLRGEPIAARPAGRLERLARWARRSPAAAALLAVTLLLATTVLAGGGWLIGRQILIARAVEADLREAEGLQQRSAFSEAGGKLDRAWSRLGEGGPFWMYPVVEVARRDYELLVRLEAIHLNRFTLAEGRLSHAAQMRFNKARADRDYADAFRGQGLGEPANDPARAATRVRAFKWAAHLVTALDDWAVCAADPARQDWVVDVARQADPDPWRDRVRDLAAWRDGKALAELARAAPQQQAISLQLARGERLTACGEDGVGFLRRVQEQHPDDFWANFTLALAVHGPERYPGGNPALALAHYEKALEIRPQAVAARDDLAVALMDKGWMWDNMEKGVGAGAYTVFYQVVKSDARFAPGFNNLGVALKGRGDWGLSVLLFRDALQIDPQLAPAHFSFGEIRAGSGLINEAIDHYRQALAIDPDFGLAHYCLGVALLAKGRRDEVDDCYPESAQELASFRGQGLREASAYYQQAMSGDADWILARNPLRIPPQEEAQLKAAIDHFRQAVRLEPTNAQFHRALGQALLSRWELAEAEAEIRRGLKVLADGQNDLRPNLERLLQRCQRLRSLEGRLPAVVQGTDRPASADCRDLAELCFVKSHCATAARLYAEALAANPQLIEDLHAGHRYNAARAAALASSGQGDDVAGLKEPDLMVLRQQARSWLQLDLAAWAKKVDTGTAADCIQARRMLPPWRDDPDLAGLREADALRTLPAAEREECQALWQELSDLLGRSQTTP